MKKKTKKKWFWLIIIVILIIVLIVVFSKKEKVADVKKSIQTIEASLGEITIKIEETGEIQPIKEIAIKSKISGKVIKFYVDENDYVKEGDLIAEIEPDYNQARSISSIKNELKIAEIRLRNAEKNFEDIQVLHEGEFVSTKEFDDAKDELEKATLDYNITLDQHNLIKEIDTSDNISKVYATASGTVIERNIEEGEMVTSSNSSYSDGTVLIKVADLTQMLVKTTINEVDIAKIKMKQDCEIRIDAFPYDIYTGYINKIAAKAIPDNNVKVFPIEIIINQKDKRLKPGLSSNVTIYGEKRTDIVTIPIRAIFSDDQGNDIVYLATQDSIKHSIPIKLGINDLQKVEVLQGLNAGDRISLQEPLKQNNGQSSMSISFQ
ncbi:MAG: efflux RND transporter periplasmic adaptor subunit [Candidatus Cloacimonadales bacterium]|jgi:HlyD family secretion protein|nr:efflux RND transporter periplasmic adaptor subunit [Candidatus Cloacimonadota bacterium]MDD2650206.1 efflux RND transporter periplasmic adaptor subunit [Candidatus Cloacimonadota bacterium]MDD3501198.1 efflux RND transporter periplasmic adaptor subunit [Candidatus Cloacimonadota bacterium]MDX9977150.1 efflux RND transporter periplasmic adaptor subunit [Candidatus Cloacimonadales bacterium]HPY97046.1 efflux RND transporter periplasmic adaptor subunit [Candidatus Cloacimonadota bacterium]